MKKLELHWQILIGMALGVLFALLMVQFDWGPKIVSDWIKPFGNIFINSLKLIAVPLILASLIKGVSDLKDISKLSKMGGRTIGIYIVTTIIAVTIGLLVVNVVKPGGSITEDTRNELVENYKGDADNIKTAADKQKEAGPLQALEDLVPSNIFKAASDNGNMLQVIFFAIFFGIGLILIPEKTAEPVKKFFDGFNEVILKLIDIIMLAAPYGVFALLAALVVESPSLDLFQALAWYAFCVLLGLALMLCVYLLIAWIFTKTNPAFFMKGMSPAQLLAFSTSSSAATLPVTMERVEEHLGVEEEVTSFVLPIGATINMDGTSLYQAVAAVFIAQAFGMDLSLSAQLGIIVTATLASIGSAAVPGAGMVMLVIVLAQAGIPEAGLALIFAVDRPLDMCRTVVNVSGDATVSLLVAKSVDKLGEPKVKNWDDNYRKQKES
ncbi:MAG: dicarboxylate/amino acid:cation symporter [Allomuricauda sp.]|jgi:Na+/H+-dicarboxylate symporter|uniref:Dicarboxylate/amino acid:cation symporter n=1 Tax=Flagellimonas sp. MMG031 TaxID=3158549 RepID=A0AAU7MUM5_9FLAO|nr:MULTISPECIES: dicarboxylate/amino acid:cation symporter [unclassified Allomuricauda]MBO6589250.1 dicarboxylate/amino acid:cation symporter [Allomuricauda sp.]MBO6618875.1 dicarboxylate/amino acid:cation symporter [Allomuricauda sp.]MBO6644788.1 dicarboxylate/amino acid:cation symporter [Allomuricauda sp.]MBO6746688.1 dicarboxylate/amino acid:cation symporter [Allomuricauda sp.]MBO6829182.1 dicarboxylate/amino acid:cation symporter [Allomuricauda sp.]